MSKPGKGLSNTKGLGQLVLVTVVEHKKVFLLQIGEYFQLYQEDEPRNTIDIYQTVIATALGPQYNLHGAYF